MTIIYPLNLFLVSLAAGITFYLGFLPIKDVPRGFFIKQAFLTIILWAVAAFISGMHIGMYIIGCGLMATTAWRQFCFQREFIAKLWLSGAMAFGGIFCMMLLMPSIQLPAGASVWFITSVYFGAFVLTTTHMATMIAQASATKEPLPEIYINRALSFVFLALALRALLLLGIVGGFPGLFGQWGADSVHYLTHQRAVEFFGWIGLGLFLPAILTFVAWGKLKQKASVATLLWILSASQLFAFIGEYLARRLFL